MRLWDSVQKYFDIVIRSYAYGSKCVNYLSCFSFLANYQIMSITARFFQMPLRAVIEANY